MTKTRHKRFEEQQTDPKAWMTTFNDMVTLLMVFFVLLFTMGNLDIKRLKHFQNALQSAMGILHEGRHAPVGMITETNQPAIEKQIEVQEAHSTHDGLKALDHTQGIEAEYTSKGIQLTLNDQLLFTSGSAEVTTAGKALLIRVSKVIKPFKRMIRVEGHTDNVPIRTARFPSNWELSTERAINVVKIFLNEGGLSPSYLSAVGYGDVKPKSDNDSPVSKSQNRRVEIILGKVKETQTLN